MSALSAAARPGAERTSAPGLLARWWPLLAITALGAALRLSTLGHQSLWYDEAFTPVHVLHAGLGATLRSLVHSENTPPLWYLIEWADARVLGTGAVALRLPSALAGIATVPAAWAVGRELAGSRAAALCAAIVAVNPLFVWYSQEARAYALFAFLSAVAIACFLRALRTGTPRAMAAFAISGALALLTHYFAAFLLIGMALLLLRAPARRRRALPAIGVIAVVGIALVPLIAAQGGHGTQWIGRWPISQRLQAIPQYYLTGYSGSPLGHGIELLVALPLLAALAAGAWRLLEPHPGGARRGQAQAGRELWGAAGAAQEHAAELARHRHGAAVALVLVAAGVLTPIVLVAFGADYLAPRNLLGAMVAVTALVAVVAAAPRGGALAGLLAGAMLAAFLAITVDVNLSPRLQRGNWRGVAAALGRDRRERAITTVELGAAPLEYYLPGLRNLKRGSSVRLREIDETGYAPLRASAGSPPAPGFTLRSRLDIDGLIVLRFRAPAARNVSESALRHHVITLAHPEVLVPADAVRQGG